MSIKKRLIFSNVAMIIIPVLAIFLIEILLGYVFFYMLEFNPVGEQLQLFLAVRIIGFLLVLIITNGLLTYFVANSIIKPVRGLSRAAKEISDGNLDYRIQSMGKDELGQLAETFEMMRQKLKEASEDQERYEMNRKELIASISHDLKTPTTSIKGYVKGIRDGIADTPEKMERYIETIYTKANDLDQLIDELFLFSKLELQEVPFHFTDVNLHAYLADFIEELRFDFMQHHTSVAYTSEPNSNYVVKADREKLKRVLTNIIQNSLKYMNKFEKKIKVNLKDEIDHVIVEINDNGCGISEGAVLFIFERFYRTDASRNTSTGGSGLGLAIVKRIIDEHHGTVWAESTVGVGTSIYFTLPKEGVGNGEKNFDH